MARQARWTAAVFVVAIANCGGKVFWRRPWTPCQMMQADRFGAEFPARNSTKTLALIKDVFDGAEYYIP
jgi:hypothetical protein